jgi:hypothetical protein
VVDPTTQGVPYKRGTRVGRFEVSASDRLAGRVHAKLYRHFGPPMPTDVRGTYSAWFYLSPNYTLPFSSRDAWANIFQWKEWANGGSSQAPLWWLELRPRTWIEQRPNETWVGSPPAGGDDPVAFIDHWTADNNSRAFRAMTMPRGRWVELRAVLLQRQRIDFYVDGQFLDTAFDSSYPVSPFRGDPQGFFIFGVGNYGTASGVLYVDDVSYTKP